MPLAFVQGTDIDGTVAGTTGVSKAFATNPTPGNMIVCMSLTTISSAGTCTFTDTYGSTINVTGNTGTLVTGSSITIAILAGTIHSGSGTDTVAAKWTSSSTGYVHLAIAEFSGVSGGTVTGNGYNSANSSEATSPFNGASLTTTQAGAVLVEYMASNGTGGANTPWSVLASPPTGGNASGYQANKAAGAYTNSFTDTATGANDPNAIAAFYVVGGGASPTPLLTTVVSQAVNRSSTY